ncbi:MAG: Gfo/Idh/MocA family oxidoreductase [Bacteroidota bacterium]|nr:Gfo/Idh/MocA family oxidoreductase [Bacteroidota bacterium]
MQKLVIVGFGFMGMTHAISILNHPGAQLVAIVDLDPEKALENLGQESGNLDTGGIKKEDITDIRTYTSLENCIAEEKPDACILSVHTELHFSMCVQALEAGIHVFVEKPLVLDPAQGNKLIELASDKDLLLMVGHVVRFMPPYLKLRQWIESGEFGELSWLSMTRFTGLPAWGQWKEKLEDFGSTGGALFDLAIHDIDYVQWVLGKPDSIEATTLPGKLSAHDYVCALWRYTSGPDVKIEGGTRFHHQFPFEAGFSAVFEKASIRYSSSSELISIATDSDTSQVPAGDAMEGYSNELDYFVECLDRKVKPEKCLPESALQSIRICYGHL